MPAGSGVGNEILAILEDDKGVLFSGTFHKGLQEINRKTGQDNSLSPRIAAALHEPDHAIDL